VRRAAWVDPNQARRVSLGDYADRWITEHPRLAPRTVDLYRTLLRLHIGPQLGTFTLAEVSAPRVRSWHADLVRRYGPKATTPAKAYRLLRAILNTAVSDGLIAKSPCVLKGAGLEKSAERPIATLDEINALADAIEPRLRLMVLLAAFAGLRLGEVRALTRSSIDIERCKVRVVEQIQDLANGELAITPPKSEAGRRVVALPSSLIPEVLRHLDEHAAPGPDGLLFATRDGNPIRKQNLHTAWAKARKIAGVPDLRFHDLRHTSNTLAAATGASTKELMARMGHASPRAALTYQHATDARDEQIAAAIDRIIRKES